MVRFSKIINYVWINKERQLVSAQSPIPEPYHQNILAITKRNPTVQIQIWSDYNLMSGRSRAAMARDFELDRHPNIKLFNLNSIPQYSDHPLFQQSVSDRTILKRIDFARLIVLSHTLDVNRGRQVFYSDFDIVDPQLESPELLDIFNMYGCVFGLTHTELIENGFMGFDYTQSDFLQQILLPATEEYVIQKKSPDGFYPFSVCVQEHAETLAVPHIDDIAVEIKMLEL